MKLLRNDLLLPSKCVALLSESLLRITHLTFRLATTSSADILFWRSFHPPPCPNRCSDDKYSNWTTWISIHVGHISTLRVHQTGSIRTFYSSQKKKLPASSMFQINVRMLRLILWCTGAFWCFCSICGWTDSTASMVTMLRQQEKAHNKSDPARSAADSA